MSALKFALPALLGLYVMSPLDPIPDFLLGLGQIDDLGVVIAGVLLVARIMPRLAPEHVVDEHLRDMGLGHPVAAGECEAAKTSLTPDSTSAVSSNFGRCIERRGAKATSHNGTR